MGLGDLGWSDGGTCRGCEGRQWWELQPDRAPASGGRAKYSPSLPQRIRGLWGWGLLVVFGEAECYLGAAGVSAGWDEVLNQCRWCSAIPASPLLPLGRRGGAGRGLSEPWLLGMHRCGGCGCPWAEGTGLCWGLVCVGVELHLPADPRVEGTCCAARQHWDLGLSLPSPSVPRWASGLHLAFKTESVKWKGEP